MGNKGVGKGYNMPAIGSILSGSLASACCIIPALAMFLGLGSASWFMAMAPLRPFFAAFTLLFLGFGFWRWQKNKNSCTASGCKTGKPVKLIIAAVVAILLLLYPPIMAAIKN